MSQLRILTRLDFNAFLERFIQNCDFLGVDLLLLEDTFSVKLLGVVRVDLMRVSKCVHKVLRVIIAFTS